MKKLMYLLAIIAAVVSFEGCYPSGEIYSEPGPRVIVVPGRPYYRPVYRAPYRHRGYYRHGRGYGHY